MCVDIFSTYAWWACSLSTVPSPPVLSYSKNIDTLVTEIKKLAATVQCSQPTGTPDYLRVVIPARSIQSLQQNMESIGYSLDTFTSDIGFYFNNTGMMMQVVASHQTSILDMQKKIMLAGQYVGSKCAQSVTFTTDVTLNNSTYSTKGSTLQQVLGDMYQQTKQVLFFFRNLTTNVADRTYIDEIPFPIAPTGFANAMRSFYTSKALQQCHDEDPKNKAIMDAIKKAFTTGWKYPQAIKIWKDAFALLLYRSGNLVGATKTDPAKEAQINNLVKAQKGGISNSRFILNSEFFKEFGSKAQNQTIQETVQDMAKRVAYQTFGFLFARQATGDVAKTSTNGASVNLDKYATYDTNAKDLATLDQSLYADYARRKTMVGQSKAQDANTVTGLVQTIELLEKNRAIIESNTKLACAILGKQGQNYPHPDCKDFVKG